MSERLAPSRPETGPAHRICEAVTDGYYALLHQRRDLLARGLVSPLVAAHYSDLTSDLLVTGIKAAASDAVCSLTEGRISASQEPLILRPYRGFANYPTWAAHAWLSRDATTASEAEELVTAAEDALTAGAQLAAYMAQHTGADPSAGGMSDLLAAGLELAHWDKIARWFAPDAGDESAGEPWYESPLAPPDELVIWPLAAERFAPIDDEEQPLDEHGNYRSTTWDDDEPEGGETL